MKHLQQHSAGSSRHQSQSVQKQWATHPKGKLVWGDIKHGAVAIPLIFTTFSTNLPNTLSYLAGLELQNYLTYFWILWQKSFPGQMKNKVIARHSWDISTYRTQTQQQLKPWKAEVRSFCSPCTLQVLFQHTLAVWTLLQNYPKQQHCKPQNAAL